MPLLTDLMFVLMDDAHWHVARRTENETGSVHWYTALCGHKERQLEVHCPDAIRDIDEAVENPPNFVGHPVCQACWHEIIMLHSRVGHLASIEQRQQREGLSLNISSYVEGTKDAISE